MYWYMVIKAKDRDRYLEKIEYMHDSIRCFLEISY